MTFGSIDDAAAPISSYPATVPMIKSDGIKTFGSVAARQKMLSTGRIGRSWAANYTTTSRLPLHPSLGPPNTDYDPETDYVSTSALSHAAISFVHGGLAPTYPDLTPFPSRINELGTSLLRKLQHRTQPPPHPPSPYPGLPHESTMEEHRLYGSDGPLWYRGWALDPEEKVCAEVDEVLQKTGTRRMIMGHTPDFQVRLLLCFSHLGRESYRSVFRKSCRGAGARL